MKRANYTRATVAAFLALTSPMMAWAQDVVQIHRHDGVTLLTDITSTDSIDFSDDRLTARFHLKDTKGEVSVADIDSITFGPAASEVSVAYTATGVKAVNPYAFRGLDLSITTDRKVVANAQLDQEITYRLSGQGTGTFKLYSTHKQILLLDGISLTATDGPAINIQSKKKTTVQLADGQSNALTDAATYADAGEEDQKGTLFSEGQLVFEGNGSLDVTGLCKHAICSDDYVRIKQGHITVKAAANDGIHAKDYFQMDNGELTVSGTTGDCVDAGEGTLSIGGGTLLLTAATADTKALKCDSALSVTGGQLTVNLTADQTKGLKSGGRMLLSGGTLQVNASGNAVVADGDVSYCAAIKCDSTPTIDGADIRISHSGKGGKGISTDGDTRIISGNIQMELTGDGDTYTDASNSSDTYCATGIKTDGNLLAEGGTLVIKATGKGGKCISTDGTTTLGTETAGPSITATTTGSKISSSSGGWGGGGGWWAPAAGSATTDATTRATGPVSWGGGPGGGPGGGGGQPGGGPGQQGGGGNPKAIRGEGTVTVNNGTYVISTAQDGGEGIESKQTLTINGGTLECNTYDDCLNASKAIVINGGQIYCYASGNDGIDSNGTLTINGGLIVSSGTSAPEEGFDCDDNTFAINGGTLVGFGGGTSTPTASASSQCSVVWSRATASDGLVYTVCDASGNQVMSFTVPRAYGSATILFSTPALKQSAAYTIRTGGTLSGGTAFHGLTTGATYSGGTTSKSFTASSKVTSL